MRRRPVLRFLAGLIISSVISSSPAYSTVLPRHKNPAQIKEESFFPVQLISLYAQVVSWQLKGRWDLASSGLKKSFLSYIPESIRYIFTRFNELLQGAGDKLKEVKKGIGSAQVFLRQGEIEEAMKILENTWMNLLKAERNINNLNSSIDELRGKIGAGAAEKLREKITPLSKLAQKYKDKIQDLYRQAKQGKRLKSTYLEILSARKEVVVGSSVEIFGKLETEGKKALGDRRVDIFLENKKIFEALTRKDGRFKAKINFPFLYKKDVSVFASFVPKGEDKEKFYPSFSNRVLIEPVFYTPEIKVGYEEPVYPVLPFKLQGKLVLEDATLANYPVKIKVAQDIVSIITNDKGEFKVELSLPPGAGKTFPLLISTPPKGTIAPASLTLNIPVSYKKPIMRINLPLVVIAPFPLEISGEARLKDKDGVINNAKIRVVAGREDVTTFVQEKIFRLQLDVPLSRFSGWEKIRVFLYPQQAWVSSLTREGKVLVVNPLTLLPFLGLVAFFIRVARKGGGKVEEVQGAVEGKKEVRSQEKVVRRKELTGLIKIYMEAVDFVTYYTGIQQAPGDTIREYLSFVKNKLKEKGKDFELISFMTERFLYAPGKVSKAEEKEAEKALEKLRG